MATIQRFEDIIAWQSSISMLNPLRGSFSHKLFNHGFHPRLLLFNPHCGLEECPTNLNINRPTNSTVKKHSSSECPTDINNNSPVQSSGAETSISSTTPKWVEQLNNSFFDLPETQNYSKFN